MDEVEEIHIGFTAREADYFAALGYDMILTGLKVVIALAKKQGIPQQEIEIMENHFSMYIARMSMLQSVREAMDDAKREHVESNKGYG